MSFSDSELERYARHIVLREVGGAGQARLQAARVAVVGVGGLGSPCLTYLAAAGVGRLSAIDDDRVSLSNLQRQPLFHSSDIGRAKVDVAAERIAALNPHVRFTPVAHRLTAANAEALLAGHDVVADGTDSFATRAAVNGACVRLGIALVAAAIGPFEGQVARFEGHRADSPCWACFAGSAEDRPGETCAEQGVLGALAGVMGALQALEVIRALTGFGARDAGALFLFDALGMAARSIRVPKDPECPVCSSF
jgi:molybdopterin/thiamine biosynthesis adenylyltransferase